MLVNDQQDPHDIRATCKHKALYAPWRTSPRVIFHCPKNGMKHAAGASLAGIVPSVDTVSIQQPDAYTDESANTQGSAYPQIGPRALPELSRRTSLTTAKLCAVLMAMRFILKPVVVHTRVMSTSSRGAA